MERLLFELTKISNIGHYGLNLAIKRLLKELEIYNNHKNSNNSIPDIIKSKLHIGCGNRLLKNFTNIDIIEPADIIYDLRQGIPITDNAVELIFSEHFFEHLDYPISAHLFIDECYRILKIGGECIIGVPDTQIVMEKYMHNDMRFFNEVFKMWYGKRENFVVDTYIDLVNYHMRDQLNAENYEPHFWGYDFKKLEAMFLKAGFKSIKKWQPDEALCNPKRIKYSLYVSATK